MRISKLTGIRLTGVLLAIVGYVLWFSGKNSLIDYDQHGFEFSIRTDYVLVVVGLLILLAPEFVIMLVSAILPEKVQTVVLEWIRGIVADGKLPEGQQEEGLSKTMEDFRNRVNKRYYRTLFGLIFFTVIILPILVVDKINISKFQDHRSALVNVLQETRVDFGNADIFRAQLSRSKEIVEHYSERDSATVKLYALLDRLYEGIRSSKEFRNRLDKLYATEIEQYKDTSSGILLDGIYNQPIDRRLDSPESVAALYSLLAYIAEYQGDQGEYLDPYLQARQLGLAALSVPGIEGTRMPAAHYMMGLGYSGAFKRYEEYSSRFSLGGAKKYETALGESRPLRWFELGQAAEGEYEKALADSDRFFSQARYLNNNVDLQLSILKWAHFGPEKTLFKSADESRYLREHTGIVSESGAPDTTRLVSILDDLKEKIDHACELSRQPQIFFTRAQLYSLGGELAEKYSIQTVFWSDAERCRLEALENLRTARSLGLESEYFDPGKATTLTLGWIMKDQGVASQLTKLSADEY